MVELNQKQKEAAEVSHGIFCVLACPGSGKTSTMTYRIANLVKNHKVSPESILGLTFSRNAAQAMREKLKPLLDGQSSKVTLSTFHSFCLNLLKNEGKVFEILQGTEQIKFIKQIMQKEKVKELPAGMLLREIGLAKNNLISADEFKTLYEGDELMQTVANIYTSYEKEKQKKMLLDFNDLLIETNNLLKEREDVKEKYQKTYIHLLVDEYQDSSPAQLETLKLLINNNSNKSSFWICADEAQSIYSFMGASIWNVLNFGKVFPKSKSFILDNNYRSTPQILKVCQNLINHNSKKIEKTLKTNNQSGEEVIIIEATNEDDEALKIVNEITDLTKRKGYAFQDIAVLYRANSQSRAIEETFTKHKIPYHIENGTSFYQRYEVKVLLEYLRLLQNPDYYEADEALKTVINVPNRYIGKSFVISLAEFAAKKNVSLYSGLKMMPVEIPYIRRYIKEFTTLIDPLVKDASKIEPSEMIQILRQGLDYDRYITDEDIPSPDDSKIENINQLQMVANKYRDIKSLLNYTDTFKDEISNNTDGVSLMTIHKSKGLEFPSVFVIGLVEGVLPNKNGDIEEERRIAFVGMSRAMKMLYLTYSYNYMGRAVKKSKFLDEITGR